MRPRDPIPDLKQLLGTELAARVAVMNGDDAGALLETDRFRIADLRRGNLTRFSLETLVRFITRAGYRVEIQITRRRYNEKE